MGHLTEVLNIIDGKKIPGVTGEYLDVHNPATGQVIAKVTLSDASDVTRAIAAAYRAQRVWAATPLADRSNTLNAVVELFERNRQELIDLEVANTGKPITAASQEEFPGISEAIRNFANGWRMLSAPPAGQYVPGTVTYVQREPLGVVSAITPWNYPLWQAIWKIVPAIATGNAVVVKPSEVTPLSTTRFVEMIQDLLPAGLVNIVNGRGAELGEELVLNDHIELVTFTGSTRTGRLIAQSAATRPKRAVMELGGNAPVIVCDDVDIEQVAEKIAAASLYNAGQECMAATRLIVHESIADAFVAELTKHFEAAAVGDPLDSATVVGPLSSAQHLQKVTELVASGVQDGRLVTGGRQLDRPGYFFAPTIITNLEQSSRAVQEEIFGPVATVQTFTAIDDAVEMANGVEYGLAASVWTNDVARGVATLGRLDFGNVWLNSHLALSPAVPIGGFKASGYGKEGGLLGMEEFTRVKQVCIATE